MILPSKTQRRRCMQGDVFVLCAATVKSCLLPLRCRREIARTQPTLNTTARPFHPIRSKSSAAFLHLLIHSTPSRKHSPASASAKERPRTETNATICPHLASKKTIWHFFFLPGSSVSRGSCWRQESVSASSRERRERERGACTCPHRERDTERAREGVGGRERHKERERERKSEREKKEGE